MLVNVLTSFPPSPLPAVMITSEILVRDEAVFDRGRAALATQETIEHRLVAFER